jgi:Caspase domain/WD domain, G-beta repeat
MIAALALVAIAELAPPRAAGLNRAEMSADAIKALEQRLTDAGCYKGAIDARASDALDEAIKACPDQRPFLRIETGMHTSIIHRIGVDAACRLLATASDDKTVRIWSLPDGKLQRVVRLPIADGHAGKVNATALSPDGRWLVAGGWDAAFDKIGKHSLAIVDLSSGAIRRFGAFDHVITSTAFSADGRRVAVGLYGKNGVRVFDSTTGTVLFSDPDYGGSVYGLAFGPDGALLASSYDGQLRRYPSDFKSIAKRAAPGGREPFGVAIDPSGRHLAVGYAHQNTAVWILDARSLAPLAKAQTDDLRDGNFESVAWSPDGATLVSGGHAHAQFAQGEEGQRVLLRRFDATGRRQGADINVSFGSIEAIQPCGEGFAFAAADPGFGLVSRQGVATVLQVPRTADMRDKRGSAFAASADASSVRFGLAEREENPVVFDLAAASLTDSPNPASEFAPARVDGLPITDWKNNLAPKFNGMKLALDNYEMSRALGIRPDPSGFVLGADFYVRAYDAEGVQLWRRAAPGAASGVDFSASGEVVVVAYDDGMIRWLRWSDGEELLALFVEPQSRKWVAWTPSGYYMASAGGEDLIGWHVNRGWNQEADFFPASQFRAQYNRPDIVRLVLQTRDEAEAVRQANKTSERSVPARPVAAALPPVVTIQSPPDGSHFSGESVEIAYSLRSSTGQPIDRLDVLADGQPVRTIGFERTGPRESEGRATVALPRQNTALFLIAHSGDLTSAPVSVKLTYDGPKPIDMSDTRPKLYALLVGVTRYKKPEYDTLQFPAHDADELAKTLQAQKGGLYSDVQVKIIDDPTRSDTDPTQPNVFEGMEWLKHSATDHDLSIVFLAGHGFQETKDRFWFLTREGDTDRLRATAIFKNDLLDYVSSVPGKKILLIDACHAGAALTANARDVESVDMNTIVNDFSTVGAGVVVYGASMGKETSEEDAKWDGHGAFTKALIEAIGEGKATSDPKRPITTELLAYYVAERVKELTHGAQHPVMNRPSIVPDFPVALKRP